MEYDEKIHVIYHAGDEEHKTCHVRQLYRHYPAVHSLVVLLFYDVISCG